MKRWWYNQVLSKLWTLFSLNRPGTKVLVSMNGREIIELEFQEIQDLYILWRDESIKKWGCEE